MKKSSVNQSKKQTFMPLSASLIASLLFTLNPEYNVVAETTDENDSLLEIKTLHEEYHSLLENQEPVTEEAIEETTEPTEEVEEAVKVEETSESSFVSDSDEINEVKKLLLHAIEKAGSTEYANQLQASDLTIEELDQIFEQLIVENLENTKTEETSVAVEAEEIVEEPVESKEALEEVTEEAPKSEETVEEVTDGAATPEAPVEEIEEVAEEDSKSEETVEEVTDGAATPEAPVEEIEEVVEEAPESEETVEEITDEAATPEVPVEKIIESEEVHEVEVEVEVQEQEATPAPVAQTMSLRTASAPASASTKKTETYTVKAGDNLNKIGRQFGVTADHIASLNSLPNKNQIQVGQVLLINGTKKDLDNLNKNISSNDFIDILGTQAQKVAQEKNLYASVMVAQAALESAFGKSGLASAPNHNLFGMKGSYEGESVVMTTKEYSNSTGWITINDYFKKYPSYLESLLDHAGYIRRGPSWAPNYYEGVWRENTNSYRDATQSLQGRYATDPTYANKLNKIISEYGLTRFDIIVDNENDEVVVIPPTNNDSKNDVTPSTGSESAPAPTPTPKPSTPAPTGPTYRVKAGDTLSRIGRSYNMSVSELKRLNKLSSDKIYIGQTLQVKEKASTPAPKPVPTPKPSTPSGSTYTVKAGDTLSHISRSYNMSVSALKSLNKLTSDTIYVGQTLQVKAQGSTPAPKPTPKPSTPSGSTYTVKAGDTLSHISRSYNMSVSALKSLNKLTSDTIYVGQTLQVKAQASTPAPKPTPKPSTPSGSTYTVKSGDTLSHVSRSYNMSVSELKRLNNLSSDLIRVGQTLNVKGNSKSVAPSSSKPSTSNKSSNPGTTHTVKAGETLFSIARQHKVTVANLVAWNNLGNSDLIQINQKLTVKKSAPSSTQQANNHASNVGTHRIVRGDTLSGIAQKFGTTVRSLKEKNNLRTDLIFVGQTLSI